MAQRRRRALAPWILLCFSSSLIAADDVKVAPGTVQDERYTDARMGGLTVELKLTGESVKDVKALRTKIKSAKDDRGTTVAKAGKEEKAADFDEFSADRRPGPSLRLASPARDASTIDVAAEVELFIPSRDPETKLRVDNFMGRLDKPVSSSA